MPLTGTSMKPTNYIHRSVVALVIMGLTTPFILWGALHAMQNVENAPIAWLPPDFKARKDFDLFFDRFNTVEAITLSWRDCRLGDQRLDRLVSEFRSGGLSSRGEPYSDYVKDVLTADSLIESLASDRQDMSDEQVRKEVIRLLKGSLVGSDGHNTCALIVVTLHGTKNAPAMIETILDGAEKSVGLPRDQFRLVGPSVDGVAIDQASSDSFAHFGLSFLLSVLICRICLRSWLITAVVVAVAAFGAGLTIAAIHFIGESANAVVITVAPLVFVLTISAGVHLVNYYHDEARARGHAGAEARSLAVGWKPCLLAALTTAIGLGSLTISDMVPVWQFGILGMSGILLTLIIVLSALPGAMDFWGQRWGRPHSQPRSDPTTGDDDEDFWAGVSAIYQGNWILICSFFIGLMALATIGLFHVDTSVNVTDILSPDSKTIRDYRFMEGHLGPLIPVEILVHFDNDCPLDEVDRVKILADAQAGIGKIENIDGVMSGATFVPRLPVRKQRRSMREVAIRATLRKKLENQKPNFVQTGFLYQDDSVETWRISARVPAFGEIDYGRLLDEIQRVFEHQLQARFRDSDAQGITVTYTGMTPVIHEAEETLLFDLLKSFITAAVLVLLVIIVVIRNVSAGIIVMLPNVFPTLVLFGGMGWLHQAVDIGTVMTASIALGIAIDDTLHFLAWFRRGVDDGLSPRLAVAMTLRHCARAMIQTTAICGLGMLVLVGCGFVPTERFALMIFGLLILALVGDLILLPALLVGPAGKLFVQRQTAEPRPALNLKSEI